MQPPSPLSRASGQKCAAARPPLTPPPSPSKCLRRRSPLARLRSRSLRTRPQLPPPPPPPPRLPAGHARRQPAPHPAHVRRGRGRDRGGDAGGSRDRPARQRLPPRVTAAVIANLRMRGHGGHTRVLARGRSRPAVIPARPPLFPAAPPPDLWTGAGSACNARPRQKRSLYTPRPCREGAEGDIARAFAPVQRDRPRQSRDGAGQDGNPPAHGPRCPRPRPCAPGAPAQPPLPAAGGGTDSRLPNPVSHWYEHRADNVTRPAATSLPPAAPGGPAPPPSPAAGAVTRRHRPDPGPRGTGAVLPSSAGSLQTPPPLAGQPARISPSSGMPLPEGIGMLFRVPRTEALCVRACVPACPRVCCAVPARRRGMCGPATCGVCSVCGERSGPGPTCGAGGEDTTTTTTTPPPEPGWQVSLRYSRREVSAEAIIHSDVYPTPPAPIVCLSFESVLLPSSRRLRLP
ncbi:uncharacterized protein [Pithys albifrons albifrons]|uniref:uncharacterized protein n=1 Tax=Pithys albifrons albifrons TaxID=3385563 RepID=UPI003A5CE836